CLTVTSLTAPARQWLLHDAGALVDALKGDRVTPWLADRLATMISELRHLDDVSSGDMVLDLAHRHFSWVARLLDHASYDENTGRQLHVMLAELGQIAGFAAYDLGNQGLAQRYYITALRAAHAADDRAVGAHVLRFMAEQSPDGGRPQPALILIPSAL